MGANQQLWLLLLYLVAIHFDTASALLRRSLKQANPLVLASAGLGSLEEPCKGPDCRRELLRVTFKRPVPGLKPLKQKLPPRPPPRPPRPPMPKASPPAPPPGTPSPPPATPPHLPPGWNAWPAPSTPLMPFASVTCPQWHIPRTGEGCTAIAWQYSTTTKQLQYQNPFMKCPPLVGVAVCVARKSDYFGPDCLPKADGTPSVHTVRAGDSCSGIAATYQTTESYLTYINPGIDCAALIAGSVICYQSYY